MKSFVELHGGSVDIESMPNEGTTVVCRIPIAGPTEDTEHDLLFGSDGHMHLTQESA